MKHLLVPIEAPNNVKYLLWQAAFRDRLIETEEDAAAVWKELICVAGLETDEARAYNIKELQK